MTMAIPPFAAWSIERVPTTSLTEGRTTRSIGRMEVFAACSCRSILAVLAPVKGSIQMEN